MLVSHLVDYGVPAVIVESWQKRIGERLLPLQEEAVIQKRLLSGQSLLIEAPTSAGKTFCAEIAASAAVFRRRKVLMLVPLKAIATEQYEDFCRKYGALGMRVVVSSGDHHAHDRQVKRGDFDLAILIYEKFNQLLLQNPDLLRSVDLVVVDELQMLADADRGPALELALTKLLLLPSKPQLLALMTSVSNDQKIAEWLGCEILKSNSRPTDLHQGVVSDGVLKSISCNDKRAFEEVLLDAEPCDAEERLLQTILALTAKREQVLVFVRSKRGAEYLAQRLAERMNYRESSELLRELTACTSSLLRDRLLTIAESGVAFHHADLAPALRAIIERNFRERKIKVILATTTLAFGVNLPADDVILDAYKFETGRQPGRATVVPLSRNEYEAMSGRAGRYGHSAGSGRSLLLAESEVEAESLWRLYVTGNSLPLQSQLGCLRLEDIALDLFTAKLADSSQSLKAGLQSTLAVKEGHSWSNEQGQQATEELFELKLVEREGELIWPTALGEVCKEQGLSVAGLRRLTEYLANETCFDRLSWFYAVLSLPEANRAPVYLTYREEQNRIWRKALLEYLSAANLEATVRPAEWLERIAAKEHILSHAEDRRLKAAFILHDWCSGVETLEIENRFTIHFGALLQLSETIHWLLRAAAECARVLNCREDFYKFLRSLAAQTALGHDYGETTIARILSSAEERDRVIRLVGAGISSADDIQSASLDRLTELVGSSTAKRITESLKAILKSQKSANAGKEEEMPMLRLRGSLQGDRVPIRYASEEIDLTPKSFSYLFKLSAWRLLRPDGWVSKDEIEPGFNQAKNIYRVKQELKRSATGLEKLIENNKSGCYRINLAPEQIWIDYESMESFCDMELLSLTRMLRQRLAS